MPSVSVTTEGHVTCLSLVVNRTFNFFSQIEEVLCFPLQLAHVLLLQKSETRFLGPVQLSFSENIAYVLNE